MLPASPLHSEIRSRFDASKSVDATLIALDVSDEEGDRLRDKNFTWFLDSGDLSFSPSPHRPTAGPRTLNFTSPTLNAGVRGRRQVICVFSPPGGSTPDILARTSSLLQRIGVGAPADDTAHNTFTLGKQTWSQDFGAFEGATYGRRLTSRSLRQSIQALLPPRWWLAHSGGGIPGVLGCLQMGGAVAEAIGHRRQMRRAS